MLLTGGVSLTILWLLALFDATSSSLPLVRLRLYEQSPRRIKRNFLDVCSDTFEVDDPLSVHFSPRFKWLERPWLRSAAFDRPPRLYEGSHLRFQWAWVKSLEVRGLGQGITVEEVMRYLDANNCTFMPWGDSVRDMVMGFKPLHIDGLITCNAFRLYELCKKKFKGKNCVVAPWTNTTKMAIGNPLAKDGFELVAEPLEVSQWMEVLNAPPTHWDFTATSMGLYDNQAGRVYLVDMTGHGVDDTCERKISLPVAEKEWEDWTEGDFSKILRYYKLRSHGFSPSSISLREFIRKQAQKRFGVKKMQQFYCIDVLDGVFTWTGREDNKTTTAICEMQTPDETVNRRITFIREAFKEDLGSLWKDEMLPAIDGMDGKFLSAAQMKKRRYEAKKTVDDVDTVEEILGEPRERDLGRLVDLHSKTAYEGEYLNEASRTLAVFVALLPVVFFR